MKSYFIIFISCFALNISAETAWKVIYQNNDYTLRCIDFDDHQIAYAVGDDGLIVKTTDGGQTWKEQSKGVFGNLKLVTVLNKDTVVASGDNFIIRTVNGGTNWIQVFTGTDEVIRYLKFMTNYLAEMPGRVVAAGNDGLLIHSNSYGENWFKQDAQSVSRKTDILYSVSNYISSVGDTVGVIVGTDGVRYTTRNSFKSSYGAKIRVFQAGEVDVIHTDHKFSRFDNSITGMAMGKNGYFRYLYDGGGGVSFRATSFDMYGGLYYDFATDKNYMIRLCVGKGGVISEGVGPITNPKWTTITKTTNKDLNWVDEGIDPANGDNVVLLAVGDGVILHRSFGSIPVSANKHIEQKLEMSVYPNPTLAGANLAYKLDNTVTVSMSIFDVEGNLIEHQQFINQVAGDYQLPIDRIYQAGIYIIRLRAGNSVATRRLVKQ